ncbi:MAG: alpha/beta hydrolase [Coriobacteriales bacterium]|nr:alpha/beta hydrolase [Coriobacteriales bacterium]
MDIRRSKIDTRYGDVAIYEVGNGDPLIFLGGYSQPFALADYYGLIERLSEKYKVLLIDLMGYGNSDIAKERWGFSKNLEVIDEVISRLALHGFSIAGHSLGGNYALCYALTNPDKVERIVLLDTYPYMNNLLLSINRIFFFFIQRMVKKARKKGDITYKQVAEKMGYTTGVEKYIPDEIITELENLATMNFLNQNVIDELSDTAKTLKIAFKQKPVAVPCLAFCRSLTFGSVKRLKRKHFPDTEIIHLGKTSHNIHIDNLDVVAEKILSVSRRRIT